MTGWGTLELNGSLLGGHWPQECTLARPGLRAGRGWGRLPGGGAAPGRGLWPWVTVWVALQWGGRSLACLLLQDVGLLEYPHHPRDYTSHLSPSSIIQPQRRRPSLLSEFQPGNER